jgi:hypothetical protein
MKVPEIWRRCTEVQGEYVEKQVLQKSSFGKMIMNDESRGMREELS